MSHSFSTGSLRAERSPLCLATRLCAFLRGARGPKLRTKKQGKIPKKLFHFCRGERANRGHELQPRRDNNNKRKKTGNDRNQNASYKTGIKKKEEPTMSFVSEPALLTRPPRSNYFSWQDRVFPFRSLLTGFISFVNPCNSSSSSSSSLLSSFAGLHVRKLCARLSPL